MNKPAIPIRNIYYMLTYAWNHLQDAKIVNLDAQPANNLLGKVRISGEILLG